MKFLISLLLLSSVGSYAVIMPPATNRNAYVFKKDYEDAFVDRDVMKLVAKRKHQVKKIRLTLNQIDEELLKYDCQQFEQYDIYLREYCGNREAHINPDTLTRLQPSIPEIVNPPVDIPHDNDGGGGNDGGNNPPNNNDDGNNGHGNDPDHNDESNPGNGNGHSGGHGDNGNPNPHNPNVGDHDPHNNGKGNQ